MNDVRPRMATGLWPGWSWEEMGKRIWPNRCESMERQAVELPYDRAALDRLGVRGLQFGSGDQRMSGCLNADLALLTAGTQRSERGAIYLVDGTELFVQLDAREPLPFAGGTFDWVYAEHFIEHLTLSEGIFWLKQVRRVLVEGGLVRISTPDARLYAECYLSADDTFFERHRDRVEAMGLPRPDGRKAFMLNQIFQFYGHRWIYDADELRHALLEAGFPPSGIETRRYRSGRLPEVACLDHEERNDESVYVEATA